MNLLALAAVLLLVFMPIFGRLISSGQQSSGGIWTEMCTTAGLKLVKIAPDIADPLTPKPSGDGAPTADDCAYCPLLNAMAALALCAALYLPILASRQLPPAWRVLLPRAGSHPCGLGSRGPPIAF